MYKENLKKLRFELKMSAQQLADDLGIHKMTISNYENGKREPTYDVMVKLNELYNVNLNWFVTGKGEMFLQDKTSTSDSDAHIKKVVADFLKENNIII